MEERRIVYRKSKRMAAFNQSIDRSIDRSIYSSKKERVLMMNGFDFRDLVFWGPRSFKLQTRMHNSRNFYLKYNKLYIFLFIPVRIYITIGRNIFWNLFVGGRFRPYPCNLRFFNYFFCQKIEEKEQKFGANYHLLLYSKTVRSRSIHDQQY